MAGYQAGTVYVDVVPSMKEFFKSVEASIRAEMPGIGSDAGKTFASSMRDATSGQGAALGKELSEPLRAATARMKSDVAGMAQQVTAESNRTKQSTKEVGDEYTHTGEKARRAKAPLDEYNRKQRETQKENEKTGESFRSLNGLARGAVGPLLAVGAVIGIGGFASDALAASDATDKFADTLRFAGIDDTRIKELGAAAQEYADRTVYDLADIQQITSQLAANNVADFDRLAEAAGNLNAIAGGTKDTYKQLGLALVQVNGAGRLQTQDWNQVANAIPGATGRIQQALSDMGAYTGDFREAMSEGQISAQEFNQALLDLGFSDVATAAASDVSRIENAAGNLQAAVVGGFKDMIGYVKPALTDFMGWMADVVAGGFAWVKGTLVPSVQGVWDIFTKGDFTGPVFGFEEDSALVDFLFGLRDAGAAVWEMFQAGWDAATSLASALAPLARAVRDMIGAFGGSGPSIIQGVADALKAVFEWVGRNTDVVAPLVVAVGSAVAAFRLMSAAMGAVNAVKAAGGLLQFVKATDLAQAAQRAFNFVMSVSPVGALVAGIAALVAGLTYFFTQTETGRRIWEGVTETFQAFVGWIGSVWTATLDTVSSWWTNTWTAIQYVFDTYVVQPLRVAWDAITMIWNGIVTAIQVAVSVIVGVVLLPFLLAFEALSAAVQWACDAVVKPVWDALVAAFQWAYDAVIQPVFDGIVVLWGALSAAAGAVFGALVGFFQGVWDAISGAVSAAWSFIVGIVTGAVTAVWSTVSGVFTTIAGVVSSIWNGISSTISGVWDGIKGAAQTAVNWVHDTVTGIFDKMGSAVSSTFEGMRSAVESIWNQVKGVAARPINFIIDTVYTNGLKWLVESVASKIGLSLKLPDIPKIAEYAGGGIIPGYAPGRDTVPAMLSPGEAVLVPELVRQIGASTIIAANYAASRRRAGGTPGKAPAGFAGGGVAHFADGGIVGSVLGWFSDVAKGVADFFSDPIGSVLRLITWPVRELLSGIMPGVIGELATGGIEALIDGVTSFFKKKTEESSSAGLVGAAMRAVDMQVPYVWGGSAVPPGLDCSGLVYWAAQQLGLGWPRLTAAGYQSASTPVSWTDKTPGDLLFWGNPAHHVAIYAGGDSMVEEPKPGFNARKTGIWGSPTVGRYAAKYDAGGWLPEGVTAAVNQTGRREAVLTAQQWADVSALASAGAQAPASLEGAQMNLVLDDGTAFRAHVEGISAGVLARRKQLSGRSR